MSTSKRKLIRDYTLESPDNKQPAEKINTQNTLPATKAEKTDPEAIWQRPSYNPDIGDENEDEDEVSLDPNILTEL